MDYSGVAAASTQAATAQMQQTAQISLLKKSNDIRQQVVTELLASTQPAQMPKTNPPGIGQLVDRRA